jgi:type II secretory pathway component PulF
LSVAERGDLGPRPLGLLIVCAIPAVFSLYAALRTGDLMARYREMFDGFGAPIPPLTAFVLNLPNFWWVIALPAVLVFIWVAMKSEITTAQKTRMKLAAVGVIVFGAAVYGFVAYALYKPIMAMGNAI